MNLDHITVSLRPRTVWEAMDLGFALCRRHFLILWQLWLLTALPVLVLLFSVSWLDTPWILLILWWLKPLYEPPLLYWLGRALFDEKIALRTVLRRWPRIVRPWLWRNLTWRRLHPERSFLMPVLLLEGLDSGQQKERIRILCRGQGGAIWLTCLCFLVECIFTVSLLLLFFFLIPEDLRQGPAAEILAKTENLQLIIAAALAMSLVGPLYVAGGFMLYISRRVELEAWDIELGFKKMADRLRERRKMELRPMTALLLLFLFCSSLPPAVAAELPAPQQVREVVQTVLADKDFGQTETVYTWQRIEKKSRDDTETSSLLGELFRKVVQGIGRMHAFMRRVLSELVGPMAVVCEVLLWLAIGSVLAWCLYRYGGALSGWDGGRRPSGKSGDNDAEAVRFGMQVTPESLPADLVGACREFLRQGDHRQALALMYRGALSRLIYQHGVVIPASATERECVLLTGQSGSPELARFFSRLTNLWLQTAYGHRLLSRQGLEQLIDQWGHTFQGAT